MATPRDLLTRVLEISQHLLRAADQTSPPTISASVANVLRKELRAVLDGTHEPDCLAPAGCDCAMRQTERALAAVRQ